MNTSNEIKSYTEAVIFPIIQKTSVTEILRCLDEDTSCKLPWGLYLTDDYEDKELENETDGTHYKDVIEHILSDEDTHFIEEDSTGGIYETTWKHKNITFLTWRDASESFECNGSDEFRAEQFSHVIAEGD